MYVSKKRFQHNTNMQIKTNLNEVLAGNRRMVALAVLSESWNGDSAVVVRATGADECISNGGAHSLEASSSAGVDHDIRRSLVDGVKCR